MTATERMKARFEARKAAGLCIDCGGDRGATKYVRCDPCRRATNARRLNRCRKTQSEKLAAVDMSGARCRCGLRLPCNDCLPPVEDFVRRGPGRTYPEPGGAGGNLRSLLPKSTFNRARQYPRREGA